ncbi:senescence-associated protein-domain-containing protein [Durotheca rogersii]|uniref:senescence-associated protein-domain-containing protein n=1 Tax=Durotheca rogersii TaxID=419775 RepID=UPI00221FBE24|nr:senescence-associated protein-domain-containing protein [Durotheca rogersii]KAI5868593.1 senescence-associated protein-domain-containing protein [Durotheca rogersii]
MASRHHDPKLLYAIQGVSAYHLAYGREESLTPAGPQTLSLLMVPTSSPLADPTSDNPDEAAPEDFYLHLHLPPELDLPLPATTQIYHKPPTSYLIPRWDLGPDSGAFTRIELPPVGSRKGLQEDVDTFETILAQCTAFLERAPPPRTTSPEKEKKKSSSSKMSKSKPATAEKLPAYNPASYKPGEGYVKGSQSSQPGGVIVLIDEEDGSVIGELSESYQVVESGVKPGSKDPVEITLPDEGTNKLAVVPASPEMIEMELHPAYQKSFLVSKAAYASRLIITTSDLVSNVMQSGTDTFVKNTKPVGKPVTFTPSTHEHVRRIGKFSGGVADLSTKTVGQVTKLAQNVGATIAGRGVKEGKRGYGPDGKPLESFKPGLLNKSLMAFTTVADGIDHATRNLLTSASSSATNMVTHRWGSEAGELSKHLGGSVKNVGLVYIDVTGVSRKAIIKAVGKGMVVGKVKGGGEIIVGDDTAGLEAAKKPGMRRAHSAAAESASVSGASGSKAPNR